MANRDMELFGERTSGEKLPEPANRERPRSPASAPASALLLTNHLNLLYMLAEGMDERDAFRGLIASAFIEAAWRKERFDLKSLQK